MSQTETGRVVTGPNGIHGQIIGSAAPGPNGEPQVLVQFEQDIKVTIPVGLLVTLDDGNYYLAIEQAELDKHRSNGNRNQSQTEIAAGENLVVPIIEEELVVSKRTVDTGGVRIRKTVQEFAQTVDQPLTHDEVQVERIAMNQVLNDPAQLRYEGETMIIPVMEERLIVQKQLILTEEIRVTKRQVVNSQPQQVMLRREEIALEEIIPGSQVEGQPRPEPSL